MFESIVIAKIQPYEDQFLLPDLTLFVLCEMNYYYCYHIKNKLHTVQLWYSIPTRC